MAEKSGTFVDWEGRGRAFPEVLRHTFALADAGVLTLLAEGLGVDLGLADAAATRAELAELEPWTGARVDAPTLRSRRRRHREGLGAAGDLAHAARRTVACRTASPTWRAPRARLRRWSLRPLRLRQVWPRASW